MHWIEHEKSIKAVNETPHTPHTQWTKRYHFTLSAIQTTNAYIMWLKFHNNVVCSSEYCTQWTEPDRTPPNLNQTVIDDWWVKSVHCFRNKWIILLNENFVNKNHPTSFDTMLSILLNASKLHPISRIYGAKWMWCKTPCTWNIIHVLNSMLLLLIREFSKTVFFTLRFVIAIGLLLFCICNWNICAIWFMCEI